MISEYHTDTVGTKFLRTAERCPDHFAIISEDMFINYEELSESTLRIAGRLKQHGVAPGSLVTLDGEDFLIVVQSILACSLLGAAWIARKNLEAAPGVVEPTHILASRKLRAWISRLF
jgi:acyl-CoA synthetase (AMP-forming)/AMP-acid ligase II